MRIMIADDDATTRASLRIMLGDLGHEVLQASDGAEAWQFLQRDWVPVVITDWLMPEPDGLELCRMIREENRPRYTYVIPRRLPRVLPEQDSSTARALRASVAHS